MDKRQLVGLVLIFALFFIWSVNNSKIKQRLDREKFVQDSIAQVQRNAFLKDSMALAKSQKRVEENNPVMDSIKIASLQGEYGAFASNASGKSELVKLSNEKVEITFDSKGGKIVDVWLKDYQKVLQDKQKNKTKVPLHIMEDKKNVFSYIFPVSGVAGNELNTEDLYFNVKKEGNKVIFFTEGNKIAQEYTLGQGYDLQYDIAFDNKYVKQAEPIKLVWNNYLDKLELNDYFERFYSTVYFKESGENSDYCNCRKDDTEEVEEGTIEWVSHTNQFFNTTLMAKGQPFTYGKMETVTLDEKKQDLKLVKTRLELPEQAYSEGKFAMQMYIGPNDYEVLKQYENGLEHIIPFGRSLFGTINRYVIRPFFNFLDGIVNNKGIAIILMILCVKMLLYPLTYKMLRSQALMGALKPEIQALKDKNKDDAQAQQVETMKLYREYGVSPLGGCFPMLLQMPIWYSLFRFFPASIDFRQESFMWADDLSSYDAFFNLPFDIPMLGSHLSLFTILWVISQLVYTFYNTRHMDMSANPAMKYVQYFMPIMFLVFFNKYASGLTVYMFFSNLITIAQTVITKQFVFSEDKLRAELDVKKSKPKKRSKFQERIEAAMKEQQAMQEAKAKQQGSKKKKKK